jgi:hypothetical protein
VSMAANAKGHRRSCRTSTLWPMIERPSQRWRREVAEDEAAVAAGTLSRDEAWSWSADFVDAVDSALASYAQDVERLGAAAPDEAIWAAIERVVLALNAADNGDIETTIREELYEYIDDVLVAAGIDVDALTSRRGCDRAELIDEWRDW